MSCRGSSNRHTRRHVNNDNQSKGASLVDSSCPAVEILQQEVVLVGVQSGISRKTKATATSQYQEGTSQQQALQHQTIEGLSDSPIDVEAIEEEVEFLFSNPGRGQARNRPSRNRPVAIEESGNNLQANIGKRSGTKRQKIPSNTAVIDCDVSSIECKCTSKKSKGTDFCPEPTNALLNEQNFRCPICMSTLVEPSSTVCGHIFCQKCIKDAIQFKKSCPTCRKKLTGKNIHRIYLPILEGTNKDGK